MYSYLFSGRPYENVDIIGTKAMMRERAVRDAFLSYLEKRPPYFELDSLSYVSFCEVLCALVDESKSSKDYSALERVFQAAARFGTTSYAGLQLPAKASFDGEASWLFESFWTHYVVSLVRRDVNQWAKLCFIFKENRLDQGDLFGCMTNAETKALLVIMRIQAIISSLKSVGITNERIHALLLKISVLLGLRDSNIDVKLTPSKQFLLRLLDTAVLTFLPWLVRCFESPSETSYLYSAMRTQNHRLEFINALAPGTSELRHEIGYCPAIELLFAMNIHTLRLHQEEGASGNALTDDSSGKRTCETLDRLDAAHSRFKHGNNSSNNHCLCGSTISSWKFLGQNFSGMSHQLAQIVSVLEEEMAEPELPNASHRNSGGLLRERTYERTPYYDTEKAMSGMHQQQQILEQKAASAHSSATYCGPGSVNRIMKVLPHLLCERCFRHFLANPLTVEADQLQCTGICPPLIGVPLKDELVSFDEIFHVTSKKQEYVDYQRIENQRSPSLQSGGAKSIADIDFSGFERLLAAELKTTSSNSVNSPSVHAAGERRFFDKTPSHQASLQQTEAQRSAWPSSSSFDSKETDPVVGSASSSIGIQGIRVRNSRDLRGDNYKTPMTALHREVEIMSGTTPDTVERSNVNTGMSQQYATWRSVQSKGIEVDDLTPSGLTGASASAPMGASLALRTTDDTDASETHSSVDAEDMEESSHGSTEIEYRCAEQKTGASVTSTGKVLAEENKPLMPNYRSKGGISSSPQVTKSGRSTEELRISPTQGKRVVDATGDAASTAEANIKATEFLSPSSADALQSNASVTNAMEGVATQRVKAPGLSPASRKLELIRFITRLWDGEIVKIVFSTRPLVEKERMIFLRASSDRSNQYIQERLVSHRDGFSDEAAAVDAITSLPLFICWARPTLLDAASVGSNSGMRYDHRHFLLEYNPRKALDVDDVRHIKVGSGKWKRCINLGSADKTLVLKIEDEKLFGDLLAGFTFLIASRTRNLETRS